MTQYSSEINVNFSNSRLGMWRWPLKNKIGVVLRLSTNIIGEFNDGSNFDINYYLLLEKFFKDL